MSFSTDATYRKEFKNTLYMMNIIKMLNYNIQQLNKYDEFDNYMNNLELHAWTSFVDVMKNLIILSIYNATDTSSDPVIRNLSVFFETLINYFFVNIDFVYTAILILIIFYLICNIFFYFIFFSL